jgi:hypothetical protein
MIVQRISAISCGAAVGESPHSEEGSWILCNQSTLNEISAWCGSLLYSSRDCKYCEMLRKQCTFVMKSTAAKYCAYLKI